MLTLYTERQKLLRVAKSLFEVKIKENVTQVDGKDDFDYIPYQVYGAGSLPPKEYLEPEHLNYERDEQGRNYFDAFIKLCVQVGATMKFQELMPEIKDLKERSAEDHEYTMELYKQIHELNCHKMPEGDLENEIVKLRQEVNELKKQNSELRGYESICLDVYKQVVFKKTGEILG